MKSDNVKFVITFVLAVFASMFLNALASGTLFDSSEVVYDNSNTNLQQTNVQGAVDDLYAAATDYSNINSRLSTIESYFPEYTTSQSKVRHPYSEAGINLGKNGDTDERPWIDFYMNGIGYAGMYLQDKNLYINSEQGAIKLKGTSIDIANASNNATFTINGKNYFRNNPTSYFSDSGLQLGIDKTTGFGWEDWYYHGVQTGNIYAADGNFWVKGAGSSNLNLQGNTIKVNGKQLGDIVKVKKISVKNTDLSNGKWLDSYVSLDSGYKFLTWLPSGGSNGWVTSFPIYLSQANNLHGSPFYSGTLSTCSGCAVDFYYLEIINA